MKSCSDGLLGRSIPVRDEAIANQRDRSRFIISTSDISTPQALPSVSAKESVKGLGRSHRSRHNARLLAKNRIDSGAKPNGVKSVVENHEITRFNAGKRCTARDHATFPARSKLCQQAVNWTALCISPFLK
jgi:hypothetical protein